MSKAPHLEAFLDAARYFIGVAESPAKNNTFPIGSKGNEIFTLYGGGVGVPWCAIFVSACAIKAGVGGIIIAKDSYARGVCEKTRDQFGGMWIDGPSRNGGTGIQAQPGDLILFKTGSGANDFHVGLVESMDVNSNTIHTIEGNASDACVRREYRNNYGNLYALVRPNWSKVGDSVTGFSPDISTGGISTPLYSITNTRHDMTLREIGYLDGNYNLTASRTPIKLGVINYTRMLGALYNVFAPVTYGTNSVDTSNLSGNLATCFNYLLTKGYNAAAVAGICGNIQAETNFNPSLDAWDVNAMSAGLCQWHAGRRTAMMQRVGPSWKTNISGQLDYLCDELKSSYSSLNNILLSVSNDISGVRVAADKFVRKFEVPANVDAESLKRQDNAVNIYNKLIFTANTSSGTDSANLKTQNGADANIIKTIEVPSTLNQTGIIRNYTNYTYWYPRWNKSSIQYKLAQLWDSQGRPESRKIATISGYYLMAMKPVFGTVGDIVTVDLANGDTINGILADAKGADASSPWGHSFGSSVDVIEWESIGNAQQGDTRLDLGTWENQRVVRVHNRGTFLR